MESYSTKTRKLNEYLSFSPKTHTHTHTQTHTHTHTHAKQGKVFSFGIFYFFVADHEA